MPRLEPPFCPGAPPCNNTFAGFGFTFSSGVDITGVSVDPASAADFLPNTTSPHMGLQLLSSTDILVDVTGDAPNMGDKLILDVMTTGTTTTPIPEPASLAFLGQRAGRPAGDRAARETPCRCCRFGFVTEAAGSVMSDAFIGTIRLVGFNFAPVDWALCQGQSPADLAEHAHCFR